VRDQERPIRHRRGLLKADRTTLIVVERSRSLERWIAGRQFDQVEFERLRGCLDDRKRLERIATRLKDRTTAKRSF
jgi:hypothetical protein